MNFKPNKRYDEVNKSIDYETGGYPMNNLDDDGDINYHSNKHIRSSFENVGMFLPKDRMNRINELNSRINVAKRKVELQSENIKELELIKSFEHRVSRGMKNADERMKGLNSRIDTAKRKLEYLIDNVKKLELLKSFESGVLRSKKKSATKPKRKTCSCKKK